MNSADTAKALAALGIEGVDPTKLSVIMALAEQLGGEVNVDPEELEGYYPKVDSSFYVPSKPYSFYVGDQKRLRDLSAPNPNIFLKLVGAGK